jgi:hypothetical protein
MSAHRWPARRTWLLALLGGCSVAAASAGVTVEVWVDLSEQVPAANDDRANAGVQRQRVDRQQQEVANELQRLGAVELARARHARNAIAIRIAPERLDAVRHIKGVVRVRATHELHPPKLLPSDPSKREPR